MRVQKGWSQEDAAKKLGWTQSKLAQIETGRRQVYYTEIFELADVYDIDPVKLFRRAARW